jgi:hypothetical protein
VERTSATVELRIIETPQPPAALGERQAARSAPHQQIVGADVGGNLPAASALRPLEPLRSTLNDCAVARDQQPPSIAPGSAGLDQFGKP